MFHLILHNTVVGLFFNVLLFHGVAIGLESGFLALDPPAIPKSDAQPPKVVKLDPVKAPVVPAKVTAKVEGLVTFEVKGKDVGYCPTFDASKCLLVRVYSADPDTLIFMAQPHEAGSFGIAFWFKGETQGVSVNIIAPDGVAPPVPLPPVPVVPNPYRVQLKAAFDADNTGDPSKKDEVRKDLAELYRQAATLANDKTYTGTKQLREKIKTVSTKLADDQLVETRGAIADIVGAVLPADAALDASTRAAAALLFAQLADALSW